MKKRLFKTLLPGFIVWLLISCNNESNNDQKNESTTPKLKEESVSYVVDTLNLNSFIYFDENKEGKRPAVLIIHEWWGLNDYIKNRAKMLADLGYAAMAVDMYGNGRMGTDPQSAGMLAAPYYDDPVRTKKIFDAALNEFKKNPFVDTNNIAAMGYCFGGGLVLNLAKMGEPLKGVVSFHGGLVGVPPEKELTKAEILVCHGDADPFVPQTEVQQFKHQLDSIGKSYTFKSYPNATHAFTNPNATELGKKFEIPIAYNGAADTASWNEMKIFFDRILK